MKQFVRFRLFSLFLISWNACKNLTEKFLQPTALFIIFKQILNLRILDIFLRKLVFVDLHLCPLQKDKQVFKTIIRRVIYFAKFVTRTLHFWGHLTIHYAGEICMCPLFPPFWSYKWREKDRSFVCALLFSVSRYILKFV